MQCIRYNIEYVRRKEKATMTLHSKKQLSITLALTARQGK